MFLLVIVSIELINMIFYLTGTEVNVGAPNQCKKSCVLSLRCPDIMMYMATVDQMELTKWFHALEKGTKVETRRCLKAEDNQKIQQTENTRHENVQHGKKGPKNVNQNSTAQVEKQEEVSIVFLHLLYITAMVKVTGTISM